MRAGQVFEFSRTFTRGDTEAFGDLTRDYNPVHYESRWAEAKGFDGLICHGMLVGSMICELGGQVGWLATYMEFKYLKPVYFGDTITCRLTITGVGDRQHGTAQAEFFNQHGQTVLSANLGGVLPDPNERRILSDMIASGDPTNRLANN